MPLRRVLDGGELSEHRQMRLLAQHLHHHVAQLLVMLDQDGEGADHVAGRAVSRGGIACRPI